MPDCGLQPVTGSFFRLLVPCDLGAVRQAALSVRETMVNHGARDDALAPCELAIVEACNNAILYANQLSRHEPVEILLINDGSNLEIHVLDHSPGFEWPVKLALPGPEAEHGRGLFIIKSMMDEALYLRGLSQNRLIMRKNNIFNHQPAPPPLSNELRHTREKLALTEQVIHNMASELYTQIVSARQQKEQADSRLLAHELEIARKIQHSLLPRAFPNLPGFDLSGFCLSARHVGGDFYDVLPLSSDTVLLVVADVMGKGVPAALFAATLRTLLRTTVQWVRRPAKLLRRINRLMFEDLSGVDMFITALLVLADTRVDRLVVASAGHCPLLLANPDGEIDLISPEGMPLGIMPEVEFQEEVVPLRPSSCALLYSDGVTETRNPRGELFGQKRLIQWLLKNLLPHQAATELTEELQLELKRFEGSEAPVDDQTLLVLAPRATIAVQPEPNVTIPVFAAAGTA